MCRGGSIGENLCFVMFGIKVKKAVDSGIQEQKDGGGFDSLYSYLEDPNGI